MNRRLRGVGLFRAWCPRVSMANAPLQARKTVLYRSLFVVGVLLFILSGSIFFASLWWVPAPIPLGRERMEVVYAVANQTSRQVFLKLRGDWWDFANLGEVRVNGCKVAGDPLPILSGEAGLNYKTYAFRYDGPWEGSILITFYADVPVKQLLFEQLVDLRSASGNSMEGLDPTISELVEVYLRRHSDEVGATIQYGSPIMFPVAVIAVFVLLLLRRRSKAEPTSRALKPGAIKSVNSCSTYHAVRSPPKGGGVESRHLAIPSPRPHGRG